MLFSIVEGYQGILKSKGVYKQVKLYERMGELYAQVGGGYVLLYADGRTSKPDTRWEAHELEHLAEPGKHGRLTAPAVPQIAQAATARLTAVK